MASVHFDRNRNGWRLTVNVRGQRRPLWLGPISKTAAHEIAGHVQELATASELAITPAAEAAAWARAVGPRISRRLIAWGIVRPSATRSHLPTTLGPWLRHYIDNRDDINAKTRNRYENTRNKILEHIAADLPLSEITEGACERMARQLYADHRESTAGKLLKNARMMLAAAVKERLLESNPLAGIVAKSGTDQTRAVYVPAESVTAMIEKADPLWKLLLALARFAGFRGPEEMVALEWSHIDWAAGVIHNHSVKTGLRHVPIFSEIRPYLEDYHAIAPHARWICPKYRTGNGAGPMRKRIYAIAELAGVQPWPKPWVNLRGSARTDLEARFPAHVCDAWLGHSTAVAKKHYLRVTPEHWAAAIGGAPSGARGQSCGAPGGAPSPTPADTSR